MPRLIRTKSLYYSCTPAQYNRTASYGPCLDNMMQDAIIRFKRMQGYETLWMPGTDHASIATEVKIVEALKEEGLSKYDIGREEFLKRAWAWKEKYGGRIVEQLKKLGSSLDWQRERFTMDEGCSKAVTEVFLQLYNKGLIYRGNRIINWCPHVRPPFQTQRWIIWSSLPISGISL